MTSGNTLNINPIIKDSVGLILAYSLKQFLVVDQWQLDEAAQRKIFALETTVFTFSADYWHLKVFLWSDDAPKVSVVLEYCQDQTAPSGFVGLLYCCVHARSKTSSKGYFKTNMPSSDIR